MRVRAIALGLALLTGCAAAVGENESCTRAHTYDGAAEWTVNLPSAPGAVAVDADGAVVTLDGRAVRAVDHEGRTQWEVPLEGAGLDWPVIDRDLVLVPTTVGPSARCVALDRDSGAERWRADAGVGRIAAVAIGGGVALCTSTNGRVVAVEPAAGTVRWSVDVSALVSGRSVTISPRTALAIDPATGVVAFVAALERTWIVGCLDLATGTEACAFDLGAGAPASAVATAGPGTVIVGGGDLKGVLLLDLDVNVIRAGVPTREAFDPASIPLVAGGIAVVVDRGGGLTAVDAETGTLRWRAQMDAPALDTRPVLVGDTMVVTDWVRELHAFRWADGRAVPSPIDTPSVVAAGADPARGFLVAAGRGATGNRLDGAEPSEPGGKRPLQCSSEPGHSTGKPARP